MDNFNGITSPLTIIHKPYEINKLKIKVMVITINISLILEKKNLKLKAAIVSNSSISIYSILKSWMNTGKL